MAQYLNKGKIYNISHAQNIMEILDKQDNKVFGTRREWMIGNGRITATLNDKRCLLDGRLSLSALMNSAKFDKELQLQIFSKEPFSIEARGNNNGTWSRGEIFLRIDQIDDLIKALREAKAYFGIPPVIKQSTL